MKPFLESRLNNQRPRDWQKMMSVQEFTAIQ